MLPWTLGLLIKKGILSHWSMKFFRFSPLPPYFDTMLKSKKRKYWIWKKHNIECYREEVRERTQELTWFGLIVYVYMRMSKWLPLSSPKKEKKKRSGYLFDVLNCLYNWEAVPGEDPATYSLDCSHWPLY